MEHLSNIVHDADQLMLQPYKHLSQQGMDKGLLLSRIWLAFNFWFDCPRETLRELSEFLKDFLNITYLWDDMADESVLRRGRPTTHLVFGNGYTMYGTIYAAASVLNERIFDFEHKETFFDEYVEACHKTVRDVGMILYFKKCMICPTFDEYSRDLCANAWFRFVLQLLKIYEKKKAANLTPTLQEKIGTFVQIYNDYIGVQSPQYSRLKQWCEDLTEGKFTFLAIHAIRSHPEDKTILKMLKARSAEIEEKKRFVKILKDFGSIRFAKETMEKLKVEILQEAEKVYQSKNPYLEKVLDDLLDNLDNDSKIFFDIPKQG